MIFVPPAVLLVSIIGLFVDRRKKPALAAIAIVAPFLIYLALGIIFKELR